MIDERAQSLAGIRLAQCNATCETHVGKSRPFAYEKAEVIALAEALANEQQALELGVRNRVFPIRKQVRREARLLERVAN
jgi:hypothetical protein